MSQSTGSVIYFTQFINMGIYFIMSYLFIHHLSIHKNNITSAYNLSLCVGVYTGYEPCFRTPALDPRNPWHSPASLTCKSEPP